MTYPRRPLYRSRRLFGLSRKHWNKSDSPGTAHIPPAHIGARTHTHRNYYANVIIRAKK